MKNFRLLSVLTLVALLFTQCEELERYVKHEKDKDKDKSKTFTVKVENVATAYDYFDSGVQPVPEGKSSAGPALPGETYEFSIYAGPGHKLSFVTMFGWSNDGFFAPGDDGISLYDGDGNPVTGDVTSMVMLYDAGTQENQEPGMDNPHNGADQMENIMLMSDVGDGFDYGTVETNLEVILTYEGMHKFTVTINNLPGSLTPVSPIVWVVHSDMQHPIFTLGEMDRDQGLEDVAETGNPANLSTYLDMNSGYFSPIAPGVWVVHKQGKKPVFQENKPEYGEGLEELAEMGDPSLVHNTLDAQGYETGVFNVPDGETDPAPIFPGQSFTFSFEAKKGDYLSLATMLGKSNDLFFAPGQHGIRLFHGNNPLDGDITDEIMLWDAGTEVNEYPGTQTSADEVEDGDVRLVDDGYPWPETADAIKVTIWTD